MSFNNVRRSGSGIAVSGSQQPDGGDGVLWGTRLAACSPQRSSSGTAVSGLQQLDGRLALVLNCPHEVRPLGCHAVGHVHNVQDRGDLRRAQLRELEPNEPKSLLLTLDAAQGGAVRGRPR